MKTKIYQISGTVAVRTPRDYVRQFRIKESGYMDIREDDEGKLILSPEKVH